MRLDDVLIYEANIANKVLKDPKQTKMLALAFRHDSTLPPNVVAKLGPRPTDDQIVKIWSDLIDRSLNATDFGDLSAEGKFDDWLLKQYINGVVDYEDINGEGGDALGLWQALSTRGKLRPEDQDFNRFRSLAQLQKAMTKRQYREELDRIKKTGEIEKHKRVRKEIVLVDDDRYYAIMPLNYGACYVFAHAAGYKPNFCTSSSSGLSWFQKYAPSGPIVSITDKSNTDDVEGKWQFHAPTHQLVNADQERRHDLHWNDERFARFFPGLMKKIVSAMEAKSEEITQASEEVTPGGYDMAKQIALIKKEYPLSFASTEPTPKEPGAETEPGGEELY
jgi:hypothetical protein